jgi:hypothetical protein
MMKSHVAAVHGRIPAIKSHVHAKRPEHPNGCNTAGVQTKVVKGQPCYCIENATLPNQRSVLHVHYHILHHAGTTMWSSGKGNHECGARACHTAADECGVSMSEPVERRQLLANQRSGHTYVSYEMLLPARFPFPFAGERERFLFTTIIRNPLDRVLSSVHGEGSTAFPEAVGAKKRSAGDYARVILRSRSHVARGGAYAQDNLGVRWLAGALYPEA